MKTRYVSLFLVCVSVLLFDGCAKHETKPLTLMTAGTIISADGVPIKYESVGDGSPALVFVHCWICNRGFWDSQVSYFSDRYQVVRLDLAGHGESGMGREVYTVSAFGADVAAIVGNLGLNEVVLIGHSIGGPISMEAEKLLGSRVIGVVGVDSFYTGFEPPTGDKIEEFVKPFEEDFEKQTDKYVRSMFTPTSDPALVDRIAKNVASANQHMAIMAIEDVFIWYERDSDAAIQRVGTKLRNINVDPKGENKSLHESVVLISGVGHFVPQEKPEEFNRALERIIKQFVDDTREVK